jgi:hypothetical protein
MVSPDCNSTGAILQPRFYGRRSTANTGDSNCIRIFGIEHELLSKIPVTFVGAAEVFICLPAALTLWAAGYGADARRERAWIWMFAGACVTWAANGALFGLPVSDNWMVSTARTFLSTANSACLIAGMLYLEAFEPGTTPLPERFRRLRRSLWRWGGLLAVDFVASFYAGGNQKPWYKWPDFLTSLCTILLLSGIPTMLWKRGDRRVAWLTLSILLWETAAQFSYLFGPAELSQTPEWVWLLTVGAKAALCYVFVSIGLPFGSMSAREGVRNTARSGAQPEPASLPELLSVGAEAAVSSLNAKSPPIVRQDSIRICEHLIQEGDPIFPIEIHSRADAPVIFHLSKEGSVLRLLEMISYRLSSRHPPGKPCPDYRDGWVRTADLYSGNDAARHDFADIRACAGSDLLFEMSKKRGLRKIRAVPDQICIDPDMLGYAWSEKNQAFWRSFSGHLIHGARRLSSPGDSSLVEVSPERGEPWE